MFEVKNLHAGHDDKALLKGISFKMQAGESISLLGPNGCGKTTLLRSILGLHPINTGQILLKNQCFQSMKPKLKAQCMAYVPQIQQSAFGHPVKEVVLMGRSSHHTLFSNYTNTDHDIAQAALERVGIADLAERPFTLLSGGQKQLTLIARALTQQAPIFVMDEPVNGLDFGNQIKLLELIKALVSEGLTVIQTTHYPDHALLASSRVLLMNHGRVFADGPPEEMLNSENMQQLYGINTELAHFKNRSFCIPTDNKIKQSPISH